MYACVHELAADFSAGCALSGIRLAFLLTHPHHSAIRELTHVNLTAAAEHFEGW